MQRLLTILRAAHCRSTHHYFAIDALRQLKTAQSKRLANLLLKFHDDYLEGAKAPDTQYKDYQNHVIHVADNYWGGAAIKCQEWLDRARELLDQGKWKKAAFACGVLSHYFTDPIMPLHTAQSPSETVIHRPLEWSVCQSYAKILDRLEAADIDCSFSLATGEQWIGKAVLAAATVANQYYDRLIAGYDLKRGATNPRQGLSDEAVEILAELFSLSIHGTAAVLTRLADETTAQLPQVSLTMTNLLATIDMPLAWIVRKISDSKERKVVRAIVEEYQRLGSLEKTKPAEISSVEQAKLDNPELRLALDSSQTDEIVRSVAQHTYTKVPIRPLSLPEIPGEATDEADHRVGHNSRDRVNRSRQAIEQLLGNTRDESPTTVSAPADVGSEQILPTAMLGSTQEQVLDPDSLSHQFVSLSEARQGLRVYRSPNPAVSNDATSSELSNSHQAAESIALAPQPTGISSKLRIAPETRPVEPESDEKVHYGSPLVDAPSIGPKTAKRFEKIGIRTIRQFVNSNSDEIVEGLATRWITEELIRQWQDQARLVCEVPALSGYRAQLLVAVGCRTSWHLRTFNTAALHSQLAQFCETAEGQHILRSAPIPSLDDVSIWTESAKQYARRSVA